jgi:peptidylprolyl isomerase
MRRIASPLVFVTALSIGLLTTLVSKTTLQSDAFFTATSVSGLKYSDLVKGSGDWPVKGQVVTVNYTGRFDNGRQFDSSVDHGGPFVFTIGAGQVIAGFDEGVMTMRVGGKRRLIIPSSLAYGHRGIPPTIPPSATLIFDVELLSVANPPSE